MTNGFRTCKVCNQLLPTDNFQKQGYRCRQCRSEKQKAYWASLPKDIKVARQKNGKYAKTWRINNPEKSKMIARKTHIMRKFGITIEEYETMLLSQDSVCAICKNKCATGNYLAVDHNHNTQKIRALLCKNCNTAIGLFKEDINIMTNAIEYIKFHNLVEIA